MKPLDIYRDRIQALCKQYGVKSLYAFGSVLTGRFSDKSDIDLVVDFQPGNLHQYAENYFNLKFALEAIFHRSVDLLEEKAIKNPYFRKAVVQQRQLIYGS